MHEWSILFSIITILSNMITTLLRSFIDEILTFFSIQYTETYCNVNLECVTLVIVLLPNISTTLVSIL